MCVGVVFATFKARISRKVNVFVFAFQQWGGQWVGGSVGRRVCGEWAVVRVLDAEQRPTAAVAASASASALVVVAGRTSSKDHDAAQARNARH